MSPWTNIPVQPMHFDGATFSPALDSRRLSTQMGRVYTLLKDGYWRSLSAIAAATHDPEASVSARIRDLKKPRFQAIFGPCTVEHRRGGFEGLWEYRVVVEPKQQELGL